jgi:hypothetical protein
MLECFFVSGCIIIYVMQIIPGIIYINLVAKFSLGESFPEIVYILIRNIVNLICFLF